MISIALLGAGRIGQIHGRNIAASPRARLAAISDPLPDGASALAAATGAPVLDADAVFASADIDGVMLIAIQALAEENALLRQKIEQQKKLISNLDGQHRNLHTRLDNLEALLEHTNTTHTISKNP